ncbi:hypothetical protein F4T82_14295 [Acinetobacter lwoffii]|uniref:ABC-three component system protein n=1 Tax=Acinetobacter lwoffii TaxID=28090 RepID=UPI0012987233|nr:ABC-three component system protein [Acinetobacter lwoffii]MRA04855.1 hypothetical protein [Acinetobacter lwoffii]
MSFDASPSWSGFNYQGKVALYYALKCINSESIDDKDLHDYSLMLEDNEDFEIIVDKIPISFHQVKAYNETSYSNYSNALLEITLELSKNANVIGKIHTWKKINSKPNFSDLTASIKDDIEKILNEYQSSTDENSTLHKAASNAKNPSKTTSIIRNAFKGHTAEELAQLLRSILNGQNDALSRISAYEYDDGNPFCDLNTINEKIKSELSIAFEARKVPVTSTQLEKAFLYFLGVMDRYIINRHKTKQSSTKLPIEFNQIIDALNFDHEDVSQEYIALRFKERFFFYIDDYMDDPCEEYRLPEPGIRCNLQEIRKLLLSLNPKELWEHYRHFSPQTNLHHKNINDAFETDSKGIRGVLIRIFHEIDFNLAVHTPKKYKLMYQNISPPYQNYLPTTITNTYRKVTQIEREIHSNKSNIEILYEVQNLIYAGDSIQEISPTASMHTEIPALQNSDQRSKRNEPLNTINLIPLKDTKEQLVK